MNDRVLSVSTQSGKDARPFLGVIVICNEHKYCVPLSKPKKKHERMRDKIDFKKIVYQGELIVEFPLSIPRKGNNKGKVDITYMCVGRKARKYWKVREIHELI